MMLFYALTARLAWWREHRPRSRHTPWRIAFRRPIPATRRGRKLWFISLVLGLKGVGYLSGSVPDSTQLALRVLTEGHIRMPFTDLRLVMPMHLVAVIIIGWCAGAMFTAYCHFGRDRIGYTMLSAFCATWMVLYLGAVFFGSAPSPVLQGAITWSAIFVITQMCAGDPPGIKPNGELCT